jgi:hypothetical protein
MPEKENGLDRVRVNAACRAEAQRRRGHNNIKLNPVFRGMPGKIRVLTKGKL